jgi:hypothetical protein
VPHGVGEQLLEHEIEIEFDAAVERVLAAKPGHGGHQFLQFLDAPIERDFGFGQDGTIVT